MATDIEIANLQDSIDRLTNAMLNASGQMSGAASTASTNLRRAAQSFAGVSTAAAAVDNSFDQLSRRNQMLIGSVSQVIGTMIKFTNQSLALTAQLHGSESIYGNLATSVTSAGRLVGGTLGSVADLLGGFIKHPGWSLFTKALGELGKQAIEIASTALSYQLTQMQRQTDSYIAMSKAGATFGGSIVYLQQAVRETGIPINQFKNLVASSASELAQWGIGTSTATKAVIGFTKEQLLTNNSLINLYGNFDELSAGAAQYFALQTQLGVVDTQNQRKYTAGATDFLQRQKELSDLLGKNTKTLADEERKRRENFAYSDELRRLESIGRKEAAGNIQATVGIFDKINPQLGRMAQQLVSSNGLLTPELARVRSQIPNIAAFVEFSTQAAKDLSKADYEQAMKEYIAQNGRAIEAEAQSYGSQFKEIAYYMQGTVKESMDASQGVIGALTMLKNGIFKFNETLPGQTKTPDQKTIETQYAEAVNKQLALQADMDKAVADRMKEMTDIVRAGFKIQQATLTATNVILDKIVLPAINGLTPTAPPREDAANPPMSSELPTVDVGTVPTGGRAIPVVVVNPQNRTANPPMPGPAENPPNQSTRATGGIATGPTTVGEDGPEAVIPLAKGAVPMNIDWRPLIAAMDNQSTLTENLIRAVNDSKDIQQRMLHSMG